MIITTSNRFRRSEPRLKSNSINLNRGIKADSKMNSKLLRNFDGPVHSSQYLLKSTWKIPGIESLYKEFRNFKPVFSDIIEFQEKVINRFNARHQMFKDYFSQTNMNSRDSVLFFGVNIEREKYYMDQAAIRHQYKARVNKS